MEGWCFAGFYSTSGHAWFASLWHQVKIINNIIISLYTHVSPCKMLQGCADCMQVSWIMKLKGGNQLLHSSDKLEWKHSAVMWDSDNTGVFCHQVFNKLHLLSVPGVSLITDDKNQPGSESWDLKFTVLVYYLKVGWFNTKLYYILCCITFIFFPLFVGFTAWRSNTTVVDQRSQEQSRTVQSFWASISDSK